MALPKYLFTQEPVAHSQADVQDALADLMQLAQIEAALDACLAGRDVRKPFQPLRFVVENLPYDVTSINALISLKERYVAVGWRFLVFPNEGNEKLVIELS